MFVWTLVSLSRKEVFFGKARSSLITATLIVTVQLIADHSVTLGARANYIVLPFYSSKTARVYR